MSDDEEAGREGDSSAMQSSIMGKCSRRRAVRMKPPPHLASISDRPITIEAEDALGRARFAKSIADLILSAPPKETLRIGIYGGWGEGKTSVLRLIESALRASGHAVVWITPWATASREALVSDLIGKLAKELRIPLRVAARQWVKPLNLLVKKSGDAASLDPRLKAAESLLGDGIRSILKQASDDQVQAVFVQIRAAIGERKMVVMVDDLDRVRPELVPEMLLVLREALDQPNFFYILALDPAVVTRGLARLHEAWGDSTDFLEKIIELPRRLPVPTDEEVRTFIHDQIERSDHTLRKETLAAISSALSRNPRKLKLLLRYLASLSVLTARLDPGEIDWEALYLCQMLRLEFSDEALRLADNKDAIKDLEFGVMHDHMAANNQQAATTARGYDPYVPKGETAAKRFRAIAEAIRQRGRWKGRYGLRECLLLPDDPPLVTFQEFDAFLTAFASAPPTQLNAAVEEQLGRIHAARPRAVGGLFDFAVTYRQLAMDHAVDAKTEAELQERLRRVADITTILEILAAAGALPPDIDGAARYHRLLKHVSTWAQFDTPAYHADLRRREAEVLCHFLGLFTGEGLLAIYEQWGQWEMGPMTLPGTHPYRAFLRDLQADLEQRAAPVLLSRFTTAEGLEMFWGDQWVRTKRLLFSPESPIFRDAKHRMVFLLLAQESAATSPVVAENFLTHLRMLGYAAFGDAMTFDRQASRALIEDHDVVAAVWQAALTTPLQPRQVGSIAQTREQLIAAGVPDTRLPRPSWFIAAQQLFATNQQEPDA